MKRTGMPEVRAQPMQLTTNGIVLRDNRIFEDRLLTLLTSRYGVINAYANGANRTRSKLAASTELLCYSDFVLFRNRERFTVDKADSQRIFFGIRGDLDKLALASYFAELSIELAPHDEEADAYLKLLLNCLHLLERDDRTPSQLKAVFELRMLTMAGYMPDLIACRECAKYEANPMFFYPATGALLCENCAGSEEYGGISLSPGVLTAMRHIVYSGKEKLFSFSLSDDGLHKLERTSETYLQYQVEKTFPTLEFYRSIRSFPKPSDDQREEPDKE